MNQCSQTRISRGFALILDDSGHRKSGNFTGGVGRQYIGEIGKTDNGIVVATTHLYDGKKSLPLDLELYQHASSLPEGKKLKYLGGLAKNRKILIKEESGIERGIRLDEYAKRLSQESFEEIILNLDKPKTVLVVTFKAKISRLEGERTFAIVMNANCFEDLY